MGLNLSCCLPQSSEQVSLQPRVKISRNRWRGIWSFLLFPATRIHFCIQVGPGCHAGSSVASSGEPRGGQLGTEWMNGVLMKKEGIFQHITSSATRQNAQICWVMGRVRGDWQTSSNQLIFQLPGKKELQLFHGYTLQRRVGVRRMGLLGSSSYPWSGLCKPFHASLFKECAVQRASMPAASSKLSLILQPRVLSLALLPTNTAPTDHTSIALVLSTGHFAKNSSG